MIGTIKFLAKICPQALRFWLGQWGPRLISVPNLSHTAKSPHFCCNSTSTIITIHKCKKIMWSGILEILVLTEFAAHTPYSCPPFDQAHPCSSTKLKYCRNFDVGKRFQRELGPIFTDFQPTAPPTDSPPARVSPFFPSFDAEW